MTQILNFPSPRVLRLMKQIEIEKDRDTLAQLFLDLNVLLNDDEQRTPVSKKPARSLRFYQRRRNKGSN